MLRIVRQEKKMSPITAEQKAEFFAEYLANRARQQALTKKELFEAGDFAIDLVRAADDPPENGPEFQKELSHFGASLHGAGIPYSQTAVRFDSVDASGWHLPEFIVAINVLGPPAITALATAAGFWVQGRYGRKTRVKVGEIEAEAHTLAEVEELLKIAAKFQDRDHNESDG